jgi:phosphoglycolate phosphatase-like HAD superfamily hydrolase
MQNDLNTPLDLYDQHEAAEAAAMAANEAARLANELEVADFKWLMDSQQGRRFAWRLLEQTGVYRSSFTGDSQTFFNEGQRNIGLKLIAQIHEITPDAYPLMLAERNIKR